MEHIGFKNCVVKVILDPAAEMNFSIRFGMGNKYKVLVKILINNDSQLLQITNEMKKIWGEGKYDFLVVFNWKGCSKKIMANQEFKNNIMKIFGKLEKEESSESENKIGKFEKVRKLEKERVERKKEDEIITSKSSEKPYNEWARTVFNYTKEFGNAPDFDDYKPSTVKKLKNYIRNRLGAPNLSDEDTMKVAELVREMLL